MPSLYLNGHQTHVRLESRRLEVERRNADGGVVLATEGRSIFFAQYEQVMERLFTRTRNAPHTTFRKCLCEDVHHFIAAYRVCATCAGQVRGLGALARPTKRLLYVL